MLNLMWFSLCRILLKSETVKLKLIYYALLISFEYRTMNISMHLCQYVLVTWWCCSHYNEIYSATKSMSTFYHLNKVFAVGIFFGILHQFFTISGSNHIYYPNQNLPHMLHGYTIMCDAMLQSTMPRWYNITKYNSTVLQCY